jgi:hypothetical protein
MRLEMIKKLKSNIHYKYARYIWLHKKFVFIECCKLGIPLLGIIHDLSKFKPSEWLPYAHYFYDKVSGENEDQDFNLAWLHHQHNNLHHYQRWVLLMDDGGIEPQPMPDRYRREMLADWRGAGKAIKTVHPDWNVLPTDEWYLENADKIILHPETRKWVEDQLFPDGSVL